MRNVTVTVPDEVYRTARVHAAQQGRSVSALVAEFLTGLGARDAEFQRLEALQAQVLGRITRFRASDRLSRDEVHERALR